MPAQLELNYPYSLKSRALNDTTLSIIVSDALRASTLICISVTLRVYLF